MSINVFFALLLGLLLGMYGYFNPSYTAHEDSREIPKIELISFELYEISPKGIDHILEGKEGKKFDDRYTVTSAKFSDNTKHLFQSIRSDDLKYQDDTVVLKGNVHYVREDGLELRTNEGQYDTKASLIQTAGTFVITQNGSRVEGDKLKYNTEHDTVSADRVRGSYNLK
jgi:LPS export ABC transporter protein LptC